MTDDEPSAIEEKAWHISVLGEFLPVRRSKLFIGTDNGIKEIAMVNHPNGDVFRLVAEVRRLNADLFDAERKAVHLAEEVGRLKAEIGGQYRNYNMKVITTDEDGNSVTVYGTLRKELEKRR